MSVKCTHCKLPRFPHHFYRLFKEGRYRQSRKLLRSTQLSVTQAASQNDKEINDALLVMSAQTESQMNVCAMSVKSIHCMLVPFMGCSKIFIRIISNY